MPIERFVWTDHALQRLRERGLARADAEEAVQREHNARKPNRGAGDWRIHGERADDRPFAVIYDHPVGHDERAARIVTIWSLR
jgi:hypothetical protein